MTALLNAILFIRRLVARISAYLTLSQKARAILEEFRIGVQASHIPYPRAWVNATRVATEYDAKRIPPWKSRWLALVNHHMPRFLKLYLKNWLTFSYVHTDIKPSTPAERRYWKFSSHQKLSPERIQKPRKKKTPAFDQLPINKKEVGN